MVHTTSNSNFSGVLQDSFLFPSSLRASSFTIPSFFAIFSRSFFFAFYIFFLSTRSRNNENCKKLKASKVEKLWGVYVFVLFTQRFAFRFRLRKKSKTFFILLTGRKFSTLFFLLHSFFLFIQLFL